MSEKRVRVSNMIRKHNLKYIWLIAELKKVGISVDKVSLCEFISGSRKGKKADTVINASLEILERYERVFACI